MKKKENREINQRDRDNDEEIDWGSSSVIIKNYHWSHFKPVKFIAWCTKIQKYISIFSIIE